MSFWKIYFSLVLGMTLGVLWMIYFPSEPVTPEPAKEYLLVVGMGAAMYQCHDIEFIEHPPGVRCDEGNGEAMVIPWQHVTFIMERPAGAPMPSPQKRQPFAPGVDRGPLASPALGSVHDRTEDKGSG